MKIETLPLGPILLGIVEGLRECVGDAGGSETAASNGAGPGTSFGSVIDDEDWRHAAAPNCRGAKEVI